MAKALELGGKEKTSTKERMEICAQVWLLWHPDPVVLGAKLLSRVFGFDD